MPLSEHEQRLLEQMERALYAEDPKFATSMRNARTIAGDRRRVILGVLALLAGMALLVTGVATQLVPVGVLGFVAMLGGIWLVVMAMRPAPQQPGAQPGGPAAAGAPGAATAARPQRRARPARPSGSLTERMEERWRRRRERGDF